MHPLLARVPRLQMIAVFESAARLGSFTEAARELGITQPGVSRQMAALERATGLVLFHRTANRVRVSEAGESLLVATQAAFDTLDHSLENLRRAGPTFLLAANPGFAQQWLIPHIDRLQELLGSTDLRLRLFDRDAELEDEVYDVAVHLTSRNAAPAHSKVLFEEIVVPVASPDFAATRGLDVTSEPAALREVTKLHLDGRDRQWLDWSGWFGAHGVPWSAGDVRTTYNNYPLVINDAVAGRGVALAWRGLVDVLIESGALVAVGPQVHRPDVAYQLLPGPATSPDALDRIAGWLDQLR